MKPTLLLHHMLLAGAALAAPAATDPIPPGEISSRHKSTPAESAASQVPHGEAGATRPVDEAPGKPSDVLSDGRNWTVVPRGAVLHVPRTLANRVDAKPLCRLLSWDEFLTVNRGWLFTEEVTLDQANGKVAIPPSRSAIWKKNGKVVVATHLGGPLPVHTRSDLPVATNP
jgi:hypothetical protein